ncbi:MAG TPA: phage terminase large subunit [Caulobacteraceae bacterium]|nr:phage terminase large subunit [Caulobacteraceae bacterium]
MGTAFFSAQYQQAPMPLGGNIVKEAWFPRFDLDNRPAFDKIVQSWDTAGKVDELRDYSVCTTWGLKGKHRYLINVYRERLEYPDLKRAVRWQALLHEATTIVIEDRSSGVPLYQDLRNEGMKGLVAYNPKGDKVMRLHAQTPEMEAHFVHLPIAAPWLKGYLHEMMSFPKGTYDDQVDSTSQALDWARDGASIKEWAEFYATQFGGPAPRPDPVPTIRVRHPNGGSFQTITGRNPPREPDGCFLMTEEEWLPFRAIGAIREN